MSKVVFVLVCALVFGCFAVGLIGVTSTALFILGCFMAAYALGK